MTTKLSIIILLTLGLFFLISTPALAESLNNPFPMPGRMQGTGTFFEITDSQYLNISLESNQEIKIILESVPKMVILDVVAAEDSVGTVTLILKGLQPNKTYYKYHNSYKNETVFISDENGQFTWSQDLSASLHIWIQEEESTTYIDQDTILNSDITGSVEISVGGVTLDCNGHNITGNGTGYGIYLYDKMNVIIKNCNVNNFYYGIQIGGAGASYNSIVKNNTFNNVCGISIRGYWWQQSSNNYIFENQIHSNLYQGMELYGTNANQLIGNSIFNNDQMGLLLSWAPSNYLRNNTITNNDYNFGASGGWVSGAQDIDTSNTVNGRPIYYLVNEKDRTIDASLNPGYVGVVNSENITIRDITISNNVQGIYLENTIHSRIENTHLTNNSIGIEMNLCSENEIIGNELSQNIYFGGIILWVSSYNVITDNNISSNGIGIYLTAYLGAYSHDNKIYHNNFKNNQGHISVDRAYDNLFDDNYPSGGNYWSGYTGIDEKSGENQDLPGSDGIGDTPYTFYYMSQDRYPFMGESGWEVVNQLPVFINSNQYKSDAITQINEGQTTTESTVVFKAIVSDPDNDRVKLQVEVKEYTQTFNGQDILESDFVGSGGEARITRYGLIKGQYHWRSMAVDSRGAVSAWQEFGEIGNVDFEVKLVPRYTQVWSPYPSWSETDEWDGLPYASGMPYKPYDCGWTIADCGCAITSEVMILRFYDITEDVDNKDTNPLTFDDWLTNNKGYKVDGNVKWEKIDEYSKDPQTGLTRLQYVGPKNFKDVATLNFYLSILRPVILKTIVTLPKGSSSHFIVADGKLFNTYTIRDPAWYNTRYLSQAPGSYVYNYNNSFYGLRLFSPIIIPRKGIISIYLASPAELLITDPLGRRLGKDPIANIEYNEIPGSSYYLEAIGNPFTPTPVQESKIIWIPDPIDGKYDIQVIGIETGSYTMGVSAYDKIGQSKDVIQEGNIIPDNIQEFDLNYSTETIEEVELYRMVQIDIKPGSDPNSINLKSRGVTPVAVLTDGFFDAKNVVISSVVFAGDSPTKGKLEDVDSDNDLDLILHFKTQSLRLTSDDTEAILTGQLTGGTLIKGMDSVRIINNKKLSFSGFLFYLWELFASVIKF